MPPKPQKPSRSEQKQLTRLKLLNATVDIIASDGLAGVTLSKVATLAGLSRGICNFHFETKERLMLEALNMLYQEHEQSWRETVTKHDENPEVRLQTLIEILLNPPIADHRKVSVWLAFWGVAPHRETYLGVCANLDREYEAEVEKLLRELSGGKEIINGMSLQAIAVTLTAMIDGLWVNYLISPGCLIPGDAVKACLAFLSSFFPQFKTSTV